MRIKIMLVVLGIFMFTCTGAFAQGEAIGPEGGDIRLAPSFTWSHFMPDEGDDSGNLNIGTWVGYYFTTQHEAGLYLSVGTNYADGTDLGDNMNLFFKPYYTYRFHYNPGQKLVPYVGPHAGLIYNKSPGDSANAFIYGGHAGLEVWFAETTNVYFGVQYDRYKIDVGGFDIEFATLVTEIGLSVVF